MTPLDSMSAWFETSQEKAWKILESIGEGLSPEFQVTRTVGRDVVRQAPQDWKAEDLQGHYSALAVPNQSAGLALQHVPSGIEFRVVPGGTLRMGLSDEEVEALQAECTASQMAMLRKRMHFMQPVHEVKLRPFLITASPLLGSQLAFLGLKKNAVDAEGEPIDRLFSGEAEITYVDPSEVDPLLSGSPLRLPSEAQWEHACRAGTRTPFFWGSRMPQEPTRIANPLGLCELGNHPELCADRSFNNYQDAPTDGSAWTIGTSSLRACRGGAAAIYPWQDCGESFLLLSGYRSAIDPDGDPLDRQVCLRVCLDLPANLNLDP